jgi:hypothetical protein
MGEMRNAHMLKTLKGRDHLKDVNLDEKVVLK